MSARGRGHDQLCVCYHRAASLRCVVVGQAITLIDTLLSQLTRAWYLAHMYVSAGDRHWNCRFDRSHYCARIVALLALHDETMLNRLFARNRDCSSRLHYIVAGDAVARDAAVLDRVRNFRRTTGCAWGGHVQIDVFFAFRSFRSFCPRVISQGNTWGFRRVIIRFGTRQVIFDITFAVQTSCSRDAF